MICYLTEIDTGDQSVKKDSFKFRYKFIYKTAGSLAPLILRRYGFKTDRICKKDEPYIVIANHLTEVDMIMAAGAFAEHMYFVAGEHLLRTKNGSKMKWMQDPIFTYKGPPQERSGFCGSPLYAVCRRVYPRCMTLISKIQLRP